MYCTTLYLQKRIVYRCLSLLLLISLLLHAFSFPQEWEVWDEALVPWLRRQWSRRRYRRHGVVGRLCFLKRRGWVLYLLNILGPSRPGSQAVRLSSRRSPAARQRSSSRSLRGGSRLCCRHFPDLLRRYWVLLYRLGLVTVLLVWSGRLPCQPLSWTLLSLPLADAFLSLLPLFRPHVLKWRIYPYLVRGAHDLYLLALMVLFSEGLLRPRDGHRSLLVGSCVRVADGAWAREEITEDGTWRVEMEGHFILTWKPRNFFEERILLVLLRQLRTPQSTPQRPFLRQEWLAEWFGTHQELISRWQRYVREGGLGQLQGEYDGWSPEPSGSLSQLRNTPLSSIALSHHA